jgi:hypothetical protein
MQGLISRPIREVRIDKKSRKLPYLRDEAVLLDEPSAHVLLPSVVDRRLVEEGNPSAVERLIGELDHGLEKVVTLVELVVEEEVGLRELKVVGELEGLGDVEPADVGRREEPASTGLFLVGDL